MSDIDFKQLGLFDDCHPSIKSLKKSSKWILYTDGASRRNPGPAGAGIYLVKNDKPFLRKGFFLGNKTNNQAEYLALVLGLYYVKEHMEKNDAVYIMSDSELLVRQMRGEYRVKNQGLKKIFDFLQILLKDVQHSFCHILREYNTEADKLANHGIDSKTPPPQALLSVLQRHDMQL